MMAGIKVIFNDVNYHHFLHRPLVCLCVLFFTASSTLIHAHTQAVGSTRFPVVQQPKAAFNSLQSQLQSPIPPVGEGDQVR